MDMGVLFAVPLAEMKEKPVLSSTSTANSSTESTSSNAAMAMPFNKALKTFAQTQDSSVDKKPLTAGEESTAVVEQLVLLAQASIPFASVVTENSEEKPLANGKKIQSLDGFINQMNVDRIKGLLDKANQMQQELAVPKQIKPEQAATFLLDEEQEVQLNASASVKPTVESVNLKASAEQQVNAKELFGDKITETKVPEIVANNDLQQKALAQVAEKPTNVVEEAKPVKVSEEKVQIPQDKQVQVGVEQKDLVTVPKANSNSESKEQFSQNQPKMAATELSLESKKPEDSSTKETSTVTFTLPGQAKEITPQKISLNEQPIKLDDTKELIDKMVEQARLTQRPGMSEMIIRLRPQNLGEMTIRIIAESGGAITASFHSNNSEVRGILQESLPAIKQELSNSGLKVNDVGVYAGLGDFSSFAGHEQRSAQERQVGKIGGTNNLSKEEKELLEELQLAKEGENQSNDGGVDYRV